MNRRTALSRAANAATVGVLYASAVEPAPAATPSGLSFIKLRDGAELHYHDWGSGQPILFLHGAGSTWAQWNYNMQPLSAHFRCIAYDKRGHGRSSDFGSAYDYDLLADDLAEVIEQLHLDQIAFVAHSMAPGEVVRYITRHGSKRVARLVFVGPTLPFTLKTADNPEGVDQTVLDRLRAQWCKDYPAWVFANARPFFTPETSDAMVQWGCSLMLSASLRTIIRCNHIVTETDFRRELARLTVPTLIVHGEKDVSAQIDSTGRRTAQLIPGSRLIEYQGAAHGLFITHAERFNSDILNFVRS